MIEAGADLNSRNHHGQTALMVAAHKGYTVAAQALVEAGADLNCTAKYGLSALMLAVVAGHDSVVRLLLEAGADTRIRATGAPGFADKTALDLAIDFGRESIVDLLRER